MIKESTYIRKFTPKQREQLNMLGELRGFKRVPEILFYALENYLELLKDNARLKRIIDLKQKKIDELNNKYN